MSFVLSEIQEKKSQVEHDLRALEKQILELETSYLQETINTGNIIKGWDGYLLIKASKAQPFPTVKKPKINQADLLFSLSSLTSPAYKSSQEETTETTSNKMLLPPNFRSKRNKKKRNYAKINDGSSYKNNQEKENEKIAFSSEASIKDEEMYEYDAGGDPSDSIGLESQKERSPKKKKLTKKLAQKFKKLKMSKF